MNARKMTLEQINASGLKALRERLGVTGMLRFLQQHQTGWGDYARDRHEWLDDLDLDDWAARLHDLGKSDQGPKEAVSRRPAGAAPVNARPWQDIQWQGLGNKRRTARRGFLASAFIRTAYAEGDPNYGAGSWDLSPAGNDRRLKLAAGWITTLSASYELSLLLLPAGFFTSGSGWTLAQAKKKVQALARFEPPRTRLGRRR